MAFTVSVKTDLHFGEIEGRVSRAQETLANEIMKDTRQYVPFLTGVLVNSARVQGNSIVYSTPYARYLWEGKVMVDPETGSPWARPGASKVLNGKSLVFSNGKASAKWIEPSKAANMAKWERTFKNAILRG